MVAEEQSAADRSQPHDYRIAVIPADPPWFVDFLNLGMSARPVCRSDDMNLPGEC